MTPAQQAATNRPARGSRRGKARMPGHGRARPQRLFPPARAAGVCAVLACALLGPRPAAAQAPKDKPSGPLTAPSARQVDAAVARGLAYLYKSQNADGTWPSRYTQRYPAGVESLVILAALSAGEPPDRPAVAKALKHVEALWPQTTFARSVRALAYARLPGTTFADKLAPDVEWLAKEQNRFGGWGYGPGHPTTRQRPDWTDNANTQMALQALDAAADAGAPVPAAIWSRAGVLWQRAQNGDGGWGFTPPTGSALRLRGSSYGSMTAAGVVTMQIIARRLAAGTGEASDALGKERKAVSNGTDWLAKNYAVRTNPAWAWVEDENWATFYLWALGRAANATGLARVGKRAWHAEVAAHLLATQRADGSWDGDADGAWDPVVRTCFALLAMSQARHPVLLNRMPLPGPDGKAPVADWLDAAQLVAWYGRATGTAAAWQQVPADAPADVLAEAPVLVIDVPRGADLPEALGATLEHYVRHGGTVLLQTAEGDGGAAQRLRERLLAIFPDYHGSPLERSHAIYTARSEIPPDARPQVFGVGDYCRTRIFIVASLSPAWLGGPGADPASFELFGNLVRYGTDGRPLPARFASGPPPQAGRAAATVTVARLRHAGDWQTNPLALGRLSDVLLSAVSLAVKEGDAIDLSKKPEESVPLLWLTGSAGPDLPAQARENLRAYLEDGGMLFVDPAVGSEEFLEAARALLVEMFGAAAVKPVPLAHPLITGQFAGGVGSDIRQVTYSPAAAQAKPALRQPILWGVEMQGRLAVVLSRYGVTCPLEGYPTYGCQGLSTADARRLAANVVLYALWQRSGT